jgi:hypothetical protein
MNCREFEIECASLNDTSGLPPVMDQHRRECRFCAALSEDLNAIIAGARALRVEAEPPQRIWAALRNQLEIEGVIQHPTPAAASRRLEAPAAGWGWLRVPMGLAYSAVFLIALGVVYFYNQATYPGDQPPLTGTPAVPSIITQAPQPGDDDVDEVLARMPEEQRATFVSNWNQLNSSIENLQEFVEANPQDPYAAGMLKNSLEQREYLKATLVGW